MKQSIKYCALFAEIVKNTMLDQCATNGAFNRLLEEVRKDILPQITSNWDSLSSSDKASLEEMGNFFCKVHPLVTFAEECNKVLLNFESAVLEGKCKFALPKSGEPGGVRLIRTACSAFQSRGHQAAGMSEDFAAYLMDIGRPMSLIQMAGNRFNVIFYNGGAIYFHRLDILNFIEHKQLQNRLLKAVSEDLNNNVFLAGVHSLGIISKLITGPYFKLVGGSVSILDMNPHLHKLQLCLQKLCRNAQPLLEGNAVFDEELAPINKDHIYKELVKVPDKN